MTLNRTILKKMEFDFPFKLTPEQKSILLLWFGTDSRFGWTKVDFLLGALRVRHLYPDHKANLYKGHDGVPCDPALDFFFDFDRLGDTIIRSHQLEEDELPF